MTVQITIVGLGQIGASFGLALAKHAELVRRVGYDKRPEAAKAAQKKGALDEVKLNLPASVRGADLVLLCLPVSEIRATLEVIAPELQEGAVIMDTAPVKGALAAWMKELLPEGRFYVGLAPVLNPAYLHETDVGVEAARPDLFERGLMVIASPPGTSGEALKLASDLARLLGASPLFADLAEVDGLMAAAHLLPQLAAAALLNATLDQPGWREARKMAGRAYAEATAPIVHQDGSHALRDAALLDRENVVRVLDRMIAALQGLRQAIAKEDKDDLTHSLERARQGREKWWQERLAADWLAAEVESPQVPTSSDYWKRMLIGERRKNRCVREQKTVR